MKPLLFLILALSFVGCASSKKSTMPAPAQTKAVAPPVAQAPAQSNAEKLTCTLKDETRTLEVVKKDNGCELAYTKSGKTSSVSHSAKGTKHCEDSKAKIKSKLEKAGYACS